MFAAMWSCIMTILSSFLAFLLPFMGLNWGVFDPAEGRPPAQPPAVVQPESPVVDEPVVDEPVVDEPVVDEPVTDEPVVDEPVVDEPVVDEPVVDEPVVDEPVVDEPVVDEPVVDEPVVDEPVVDEPVVDEPVVDEPVVDEPAVTAASDAVRMDLLNKINAYRQENGIDPLALDPTLNANAQAWAETMAEENKLYHTSDNVAEIILYRWDQNTDAMLNQWKNSPGHNSIMLTPGYTRAGVGIAVTEAGRVYSSVQSLW